MLLADIVVFRGIMYTGDLTSSCSFKATVALKYSKLFNCLKILSIYYWHIHVLELNIFTHFNIILNSKS